MCTETIKKDFSTLTPKQLINDLWNYRNDPKMLEIWHLVNEYKHWSMEKIYYTLEWRYRNKLYTKYDLFKGSFGKTHLQAQFEYFLNNINEIFDTERRFDFSVEQWIELIKKDIRVLNHFKWFWDHNTKKILFDFLHSEEKYWNYVDYVDYENITPYLWEFILQGHPDLARINIEELPIPKQIRLLWEHPHFRNRMDVSRFDSSQWVVLYNKHPQIFEDIDFKILSESDWSWLIDQDEKYKELYKKYQK